MNESHQEIHLVEQYLVGSWTTLAQLETREELLEAYTQAISDYPSSPIRAITILAWNVGPPS